MSPTYLPHISHILHFRQVDPVEVEVVVSDCSDDDVADILREPSKHLPRREDLECLVGGRSTTEKSALIWPWVPLKMAISCYFIGNIWEHIL